MHPLHITSAAASSGKAGSAPASPKTEDYVLACCRYTELNPVRAAMVNRPQGYRWYSNPNDETNQLELRSTHENALICFAY